ncbi:MAG: hypothetical protein WCO00_10455 [Rhodospirillaceae bacterium]
MTKMIAELHNALVAAGAPEDKVRKSGETAASQESRFTKIETELAIMKRMLGFNLTATVAVLMILLRH